MFNVTLDGHSVHLLFDRSQAPITDLSDPRLPQLIELAGRLSVPVGHPCHATFRRLRAWNRLREDGCLYSYLSRQHKGMRSLNEWLDLAAEYLEAAA